MNTKQTFKLCALLAFTILANSHANDIQEVILPSQIDADRITQGQKIALWSSMRKAKTLGNSATAAFVRAYEGKSILGITGNKYFIHFSPLYSILTNSEYYIEKTLKAKLKKIMIDRNDDPISWTYHVAPTYIYKDQVFIFDKDYFEKPVTQTQWIETFTKPASDILNDSNKVNEILSLIEEKISKKHTDAGLRQSLEILRSLIKNYLITAVQKITCSVTTEDIIHVDEMLNNSFCVVQVAPMEAWNTQSMRNQASPKTVQFNIEEIYEFNKDILESLH